MKKIARVSSLLALALAAPGLFALDIPVGEEGGGKFVLDMQAKFAFDIVVDSAEAHDNDQAWIEEKDGDKQAKIEVKASYDGDNYAFGVGGGFRQKFASSDNDREWWLDDAWGKYYLLDKQLWFRGGSMDGLWRIDTDPLNKNYGGDNGPGVQINFAPSSLTGFNVGLALPVPFGKTRTIAEQDEWWEPSFVDPTNPLKGITIKHHKAEKLTRNWGPTYPIMNMAFGLHMDQTIPNLNVGLELDLLGNYDTNGKAPDDPDEKEGDFKGMNFHLTAVYKFAPVEFRLAFLAERIADGHEFPMFPDGKLSLGARVIFDIPNGDGSPLDLGDPWIQLQMLPAANQMDGDGNAYIDMASLIAGNTPWGKVESLKDMEVKFEWEPSYSIVQDQLKALLWLGVTYKSWYEATDAQKDYALEFAVQPKLEFKFAPSATFSVFDKVFFARLAKEDGFRNELGFRFEWKF